MSLQEPIFKLTSEMREALIMASEGMSCAAIARKLGKHYTTVYRWFARKEVVEEFRKIVQRQTLFDVAAARRNIRNDMNSEKKGQEYVRQNASFFVINKYESEVMGNEDAVSQVVFVNGVPELGMPDPTDEDE